MQLFSDHLYEEELRLVLLAEQFFEEFPGARKN
jgi:hypothetical protein